LSSRSSASSSTGSSSTSSSSSIKGCEANYCASTFATANINGTYTWRGAIYNGKPVYDNATYYLWYSTVGSNYWAISLTYPTAEINWVSNKNVPGGCPDGTYENENGTLVAGQC